MWDPSVPGEVTWVSVDKITDRYDELCKHFQNFTAEECREMESIVAHCTALNRPVQCANMIGNQNTEDQNTPKPKHRRPNQRKSVIPTSTTTSTSVATSGVLPIVGPPPSSQGITPSGGHVPIAPARIPLKRPLDHNDLVSGADRAPPPAKRADEGHGKQAHAAEKHNNPPGASTQTFEQAPSRPPEDLQESYREFMAVKARIMYIAQEMGPAWMKLGKSSKIAGLVAARQHAQLLERGVPDSSLIPVVYGTCNLIFLLFFCVENVSLNVNCMVESNTLVVR